MDTVIFRTYFALYGIAMAVSGPTATRVDPKNLSLQSTARSEAQVDVVTQHQLPGCHLLH